jgi:hypothetical protein
MKCPCPKCDATIEIPEQKVSATGNSQNCPECKDKYWFRQEKFALRAYRKQGRIYCSDCGEQLGSDLLCLNCGSLCPDYCVVQSSRFVSHKQQKTGHSFSPPRRSKASATPSPAPKARQPQANRTWLAYLALAVLILALVGGMSKVYLDYKANQEYARNFIVALYGVKSGTDLSLGLIDNLSTTWQQNLKAGGIAPRPNQKDLDKLNQVKKRISQAMATLNESPEKFAEARQKLIRLHGIYMEINALNFSRPDSLEDYTVAVDNLKTRFFKVADELRNSMPEELSEELKVSVARYSNLNFMVKG